MRLAGTWRALTLAGLSGAFLAGACGGGGDSGTAGGGNNTFSGGSGGSGGSAASAGSAGTAGTSSGGSSAASSGGSAGSLIIGDGGGAEVTSIAIEPASVTLTSDNGSQPTQAFEVIGTKDDGSTEVLTEAVVDLDELSIGQLNPDTLVFTANGLVGGTGTLEATIPDTSLSATATVTVNLEHNYFENGAPTDSETRFMNPISDPAKAATLVYPLDQAVMPQNVYPAEVQWQNGAENDIFRITISKPHVNVITYVMNGAGFTNSHLVNEDAWRSVAQTDADQPANFQVERWEAASAQAYSASLAANVTFAQAALTGSVYYWEIEAGLIKRIDDGTGAAVSFMPTPPVAVDGNRCVGCHSVSNSGRYMAGRLGGGDNVAGIFDLTQDLTPDPAPTVWPISTVDPTTPKWWDSSWSPDDSRLVVAYRADQADRVLKIYNPLTGLEITPSGTLPQGIQPAWAPDNSQIAFVANSNAWGGQMTDGDIAVLDVLGVDSFGGSTVIHDGAALASAFEGGTSSSYPSWTPDSSRIIFAHGTGARSDAPDGKTSALYIMSRDGTNLVRLDKASGGADSTDTFQPNFSPFDEGGYFWVAYLSRRDYGNNLAGTAGTQRQQIWVAAIKKDAPAGTDPSEVGYWLPGQTVSSKNISAFWAPRACREDGDECSVNSECCGGDCRPNMDGVLVCSPPPPDRCRKLNETCSTSADCCDERECVNNVCVNEVIPPPK